jgi:hypothetical protein
VAPSRPLADEKSVWHAKVMAEQFSLFSGALADFAPEKPAEKKRGALFDPSTLPAPPPKIGPPSRRFGTSSWTYLGWQGSVFRDVEAYGSSQRFTELCLGEYAHDPRFRCAGADNMYYVPPSSRAKLFARYRKQLDALPEPIELLPKVWHGITVNRYSPLQQREWRLDGEVNSHFLDAARFLDMVALPLSEGLGARLGPLILEIQENDIHALEFAQLLDEFLTTMRAR